MVGYTAISNHLLALVETAKAKGIDKVYIHAFMDGRDVDLKLVLLTSKL